MISAYESYITLEMQLRDYDMDGRVTRDEFDQHQIDYSEQQQLFYENMNADTGTISKDEFLDIEYNPWSHYYSIDKTFDMMDQDKDL